MSTTHKTKAHQRARSTLASRAKGTAFEELFRPRAKPNSRKAPGKPGPKPKLDQSYRARTLACLKDIE